MVPGSAWNWIAVKQSNLNQKNEYKKNDNENLLLFKSKSSPIKESSPSFLSDAFVSDGYLGSVRASINSRGRPGAV
jgi:hypothetical protein